VDGWCEKLREQGVQLEKEPAYNPEYKIYHCFLRDPNGYLVEIQRFEDPRWEG
jgi:catechol 2,3-dioxygenase-like lactoylglutathione lyase family enzyme